MIIKFGQEKSARTRNNGNKDGGWKYNDSFDSMDQISKNMDCFNILYRYIYK